MEKAVLFIVVGLLGYQAYGQSQGDLRLNNYGSTGGSSGRLEIYYNSQWGTVCNDLFTSPDANVACRQLGFTGALNYGSVGTLGYSQGSSFSQIWLSDLRCTGSESRLEFCTHSGFGNTFCFHSEDIALRCSGSSTGTFNFIGAIAGGIVGGVTLLIVIVVVCIIICFGGVAACANSSSRRTVRAVHPPTTSNVVTYTTEQGSTTYPTAQIAYPADPQQPPPSAYSTQQDPHPNKEPVNPEFSAEAPPAYNDPAYPPPANPYPPTDPNAGYPIDPNASYPPNPTYPTGEQYPPQTY